MDINLGNINITYLLIGLGISLLLIGILVFVISQLKKRQKQITDRIELFITSGSAIEAEGISTRRIIQREVSGSLFSRTLAAWFENILQFLGKYSPDSLTKEMDHRLTVAGKPGNLNGRSFFAIRVLVFFAGIFTAVFINRNLSTLNFKSIMVGIGIIVVSLMFPNSWLNGQMRNRQGEIRRGLPDALDMLSVCASAGLGFDQSLQKISGYWQTELGAEIKRVTKEMEMGVSRSEALKNMSNRLDVNDLSQFVAIIIQAELIGMSYAEVLHSQAHQLRIMRQVRAREAANKLPGKMIIPVILFIFPAMIAVILGPTFPVLLNLF